MANLITLVYCESQLRPNMPPIDFHGLSETGPDREDNQDNLWLPGDSYPNPGSLFMIADGMGGYARGEIASEVAIR